MSRMSEIYTSIEDEVQAGELSFEQIATKYQVPFSWVEAVFDQLCDKAYDSMDGDAESALASVGWGTDEDYGYYGDEF